MDQLMKLRVFVGFLAIGSLTFTNAGDFAIIADLENGTVYAGSMGQRLGDMVPLPLSGVVRPVAVDYDPVEKMVYWTDLASLPTAKISRAHLDGSDQVTLIDNLVLPDGLALDVESRIMFWIDGNLGQIGKVPMAGPWDKEIILEDLGKPRTIVTDPDSGYIYWTDWGDNPRIERADYNGSNRMTIIEGDLYWPTGVTIDTNEEKLYWCDAKLDKIERSDLQGNNRDLLVNLTIYEGLHPFDLAVYDDFVYWTDWANRALIKISTSGRGELTFGPNIFLKGGGIHIQEEPDYCDSFPCKNEATCVDVINGFVCQCAPGFQGTTCEHPCNSMPCINGGTCIMSSDPDAFTCLCPTGYGGQTCELVLDPCDSGPCLNGGICFRLTDGFRYWCQCAPGYSGQTCAIVIDPCDSGPCLNGGVCVSSTNGLTCYCRTGSDGPTCAHILDPCDGGPCLNGGICVRLTDGFSYWCQCAPGYSGQTCAIDPCDSGPCLNGGVCVNGANVFICQCLAGYVGQTCAIAVEDTGCEPPPTDSHVTLVEDEVLSFKVGEEATFVCTNDSIVTGSTNDQSTTRVCRSDGTWSGNPVKCAPKQSGGVNESLVSTVGAVGGGVGGVILLVILIVAVALVIRRKRRETTFEVPHIPIIQGQCSGKMEPDPPLLYYNEPKHFENTMI